MAKQPLGISFSFIPHGIPTHGSAFFSPVKKEGEFLKDHFRVRKWLFGGADNHPILCIHV